MPRIVSRIAWNVGRSSGISFQHFSIRDKISGGQSFGVTSGLNDGVSDAATRPTIFGQFVQELLTICKREKLI